MYFLAKLLLGEHAPGIKNIEATAKSMHYILLAHGKSVEIAREHGHKNVGIVLNKTHVIPQRATRKISLPQNYMMKFIILGLMKPFLKGNILKFIKYFKTLLTKEL